MRLALAVCVILTAWLTTASATDPFVQLDEAKLTLAAGKLAKAREMMSRISTVGAEDYIAEEVLYHQLLLAGSYFSATHFLLEVLKGQDDQHSGYGKWLAGERDTYRREFERHALEYLTRTAGGSSMPFVRFRLPLVSDEYLQDTGLYSDAQVLGAAVSNWEDGRTGLGKGIIGSQARVALVLSVAVHYDLPEASATLEQVAERLRSGVPIDELVVLDWLAATIHRLADDDLSLLQIADMADERILSGTEEMLDSHLREQALARRNEEGGDASE